MPVCLRHVLLPYRRQRLMLDERGPRLTSDPEQMWQLGRKIQIRATIGLVISQIIAWLAYFYLIKQGSGSSFSVVVIAYTVFMAFWAVWWVIPIARGARGVTIALVASLINAFLYLVVTFAGLYYHFGTSSNFSKPLVTRVDALYFTLGTLTTAGTGNIAPVSQLSRGLTSLQMVIDLVYITIAVAIAVTRLTERTSLQLLPRSLDRPEHPVSRREVDSIKILAATRALALATSILAISDLAALITWISTRRSDRAQRKQDQDARMPILLATWWSTVIRRTNGRKRTRDRAGR